jgi:hypothetical protein
MRHTGANPNYLLLHLGCIASGCCCCSGCCLTFLMAEAMQSCHNHMQATAVLIHTPTLVFQTHVLHV